MKKPILWLFLLLLGGCSTLPKSPYYWGYYEDLIYQSYHQPGSTDANTQIQRLTSDIQKAEAKGLKVPPGIYIQLGYAYSLTGNDTAALTAFDQEILHFPESKHFVDRLKTKLSQPQPASVEAETKKSQNAKES